MTPQKNEIDFIFFGGAFDPPHFGHQQVVLLLSEIFKNIPIHVVPSFNSPIKGELKTPFEHRLKMCKVLFDAQPSVIVNDIESKLGGVSYTVTSIEQMIRVGTGEHPMLAIGDDQLENFDDWFRYQDILKLATVCVFPRIKSPKAIVDKMKTLAKKPLAFIEEDGLFKDKEQGLYIVGNVLSGASSTKCREFFAQTELDQNSLEELPPDIKQYIKENSLYKTKA